ncbi:unnamed protein product [Amoebophrya sp. A120]|nr:unnamed protein product [Amoebophrya sp. A120]|eukprot:GSA120T00020343001.1
MAIGNRPFNMRRSDRILVTLRTQIDVSCAGNKLYSAGASMHAVTLIVWRFSTSTYGQSAELCILIFFVFLFASKRQHP